jgi:hypothetical protein
MKSKVFYLMLVLAICLIAPSVLLAQGPPPPPPPPADVPIDGGVGLLIAAGVGYGVKKVRDHRKKQRQTQ